ncbi:MAG TPA: hypothetical protein VGO11_19830 [Chthoniobacteraceae bacterium]|jgi:hypothetical protein|nr:hypothetical protein [Chthoniobacteraceae bacterium]
MKTVVANGQSIDLPAQAVCLIPRQGIHLEVPGYTEINAELTLDYMLRKVTFQKWYYISRGPLFQDLFACIFGDEGIAPPRWSNLQQTDRGVLHVCGLIILYFEAVCERGEDVFLRDPETHLHPASLVHLMGLITKLQRLPKGGPR